MNSLKMWLMTGVVCCLVFLLNIDYTAVNLALVPIAQDIKADLSNLQWLLSGYILVWGALVIPAGKLADLHGKRRVLITGIWVFLIGSLLTGLGSSLEVLIAGRLLQGVGAAIFSPSCYALIFANTPADKQGLAMGVVASAAGIGLAVGPTLAAAILELANWRWIFYINIPIGLLVILSTMILVPQDAKSSEVQRSDTFAAALLALGMGLTIYALNQVEVWGLSSKTLWFVFVAGIACLMTFIQRNRKSQTPTIPPVFTKNQSLMAVIYAIFFGAYNFSMVLVLVGLYLTTVLGYTSTQAGIAFLPMTLALGALSPIGGKLADKMDNRIGICAGFLLNIVAVVMIGFAGATATKTYIAMALCMGGVGMGLCFPALNTALMRSVEEKHVSTASGLFTMSMMMGNTIGVIVSTSLIVVFGRNYLHQVVDASGNTLTPEQFYELCEMIGITTESGALTHTSIPAAILDHVPFAFLSGLFWNMIIGAGFAFLGALIIAYRLKLRGGQSCEVNIMHC